MSAPERGEELDPVERLVFECLERRANGGEAAVEELLATHPELAAPVRAQIALLLRSGVLDAPADRDSFPERLGEFKLLEPLGAGGMGVVYRARQESLEREVALKLIRPEHLYFPTSRARFRREALAVARMRHPGIVPVHSVGEEKGIPFIAMELVDGASLADVLERLRGRDPAGLGEADLAGASGGGARGGAAWVQVCVRLAREVALALDHAHARGVLHRDVKPSNVFVTRDGRAMLLDFGLASFEAESRLTRSSSQPGSLPYMSPEQVRGDAAVDARTDVYSLGVVLYELLTLRQPFAPEAISGAALRQRILAAEPSPPRRFNPRIPRDAATVCLTAMAPERERRYASAGDFAADLERLLEHRPIAARPPGAWLRVLRWSQRHPALSGAVLAALALGLATSSTLVWRELAHSSELRQQRDVAQERFEDVRSLATGFLFDFHDAIKDLSGSTPARELIVKRALELFAKLSAAAEGNAGLQSDLAWAHVRLGMVLGEPAESSLGDSTRARAEYEQALTLYDGLVRSDPSNVDLRFRRANASMELATLCEFSGELERALALYRQSLGEAESLVRDAPQDRKSAQLLAVLHTNYCNALASAARLDEALEAGRQALSHWEEIARAEPDLWTGRYNLMVVHRNLSRIHRLRAEYAESESELETVIALSEEMLLSDPYSDSVQRALADGLLERAALRASMGRHEEAVELLRRGCDEFEARRQRDPHNAIDLRMLVRMRTGLGSALVNVSRFQEAVDQSKAALELASEALELGWDVNVATDACDALRALAQAQRDLGEPAVALAACAELEARVESYSARSSDLGALADGASVLEWTEEQIGALADAPGAAQAVEAAVVDRRARASAAGGDEFKELAVATAELFLARVASRAGEHETARGASQAALLSLERRAARGVEALPVAVLRTHALASLAAARRALNDVPGALEACRQALASAPGGAGGVSVDPMSAVRLDLALAAALEVAQGAGDAELERSLDERLRSASPPAGAGR